MRASVSPATGRALFFFQVTSLACPRSARPGPTRARVSLGGAGHSPRGRTPRRGHEVAPPPAPCPALPRPGSFTGVGLWRQQVHYPDGRALRALAAAVRRAAGPGGVPPLPGGGACGVPRARARPRHVHASPRALPGARSRVRSRVKRAPFSLLLRARFPRTPRHGAVASTTATAMQRDSPPAP